MNDRDDEMLDALQSGFDDKSDAFESELTALFAKAEPATEPKFTMSVIDQLGAQSIDVRLWSIVAASLVSLILIVSQFGAISEVVGTLAAPLVADGQFGGAEGLTGAVLALLILGVSVFLPRTALR